MKLFFGFTNVVMQKCFHKENHKSGQCYYPVLVKHFVLDNEQQNVFKDFI